MDFQKYIDNLHNQLKAVNADIVEKQEELDKLKEFRWSVLLPCRVAMHRSAPKESSVLKSCAACLQT